MARPGKPSAELSNNRKALVCSRRIALRFLIPATIFSAGIINICVSMANAAGLAHERSARNPRARGSRRTAPGHQCRQHLAVAFRREQSALCGGDSGIGGKEGLDRVE